jgi:hypothetical protein
MIEEFGDVVFLVTDHSSIPIHCIQLVGVWLRAGASDENVDHSRRKQFANCHSRLGDNLIASADARRERLLCTIGAVESAWWAANYVHVTSIDRLNEALSQSLPVPPGIRRIYGTSGIVGSPR